MLVSVAALPGCREDPRAKFDENAFYDEFFHALSRWCGVTPTRGNFVLHHSGDNLGPLVLVPQTTTLRGWGFPYELPSLGQDTY